MLMQTNNLRQKHSSVIQENEQVQALINDSNWNIPIANQIQFPFPWQINIVAFFRIWKSVFEQIILTVRSV